MSTEGGSLEDNISCGSAPCSAPGSPKSRVKFLCSHGGKILPRPADAHLKYVGGETRVISVPRDIKFQDLMKKLTSHIDGEMILKYQLIPEDLDALVSVKSDEDLRHMFDEYDLYECAAAPKLRTFLFPANPVVMESHVAPMEPHAIEQRYIDAINGVIRATPASSRPHPTPNMVNHGSFVSSPCSSPRSPESCTTETINQETTSQRSYAGGRVSMHRVQSSPSLCSLYAHQQNNHYVHQQPHHYHNQSHRPPLQYNYQSSKPPIDPYKSSGPERLMSVRSVGRADGARYQIDHMPHYYYTTPTKQIRASGSCAYFDECGHCSDGRIPDGTGNHILGSVPLSPRHNHLGIKTWDSTIAGDG